MKRSIALADANSFYCSVEILFQPSLEGKPVCVLSNNDGAIVARTPAAKEWVKMGQPWFQVKDIAREKGIIAFSSNYSLYAELSNRFHNVLASFTDKCSVYSVDEAFLELTGHPGSHTVLGYTIKASVLKGLGLPICVGIGCTHTLGKLANYCAKKDVVPGSKGVFNFNDLSEHEADAVMAKIGVGDVWGVGRRLAPRLVDLGIHTALDLKLANPEFIRQQFSVVLEKTVRELNGVSCIELDAVEPPRQQIVTSRSFSYPVTEHKDLREAVSMYVSTAAAKLRKQPGYAKHLTVFASTSPFNSDPKYSGCQSVKLPAPTDDTLQLVRTALWILNRIYKPGYRYQRAGIMLGEIVPAAGQQIDMFGYRQVDDKSARLMLAMDEINRRWGRQTLRTASQGYDAPWKMRQERLSPNYMTQWSDIITAS